MLSLLFSYFTFSFCSETTEGKVLFISLLDFIELSILLKIKEFTLYSTHSKENLSILSFISLLSLGLSVLSFLNILLSSDILIISKVFSNLHFFSLIHFFLVSY